MAESWHDVPIGVLSAISSVQWGLCRAGASHMNLGMLNPCMILYESLMAITLLALSFLAVCQVGAQVGTLERVQVAQGRAEAAVMRQVELLRSVDFAQLPARNNTAFDWNVD